MSHRCPHGRPVEWEGECDECWSIMQQQRQIDLLEEIARKQDDKDREIERLRSELDELKRRR